MSRDTGPLIGRALSLAQRLVESDTEVSTVDLNLLTNLNTNQLLNYIKLEQHLTTLETSAEKASALHEELASLVGDLNSIERQVGTLKALAAELDQYTQEMK